MVKGDKGIMCEDSSIKISVVIPMFNEEEIASDTITRVSKILQSMGKPYEILPVNDGSTDNTLKILDDIASRDDNVRVVSYWKNGGRGKAIRHGFKAARGRYIASIDADLSYDPAYIMEMAKVLDEESDIDVVLVSPYMTGGKAIGVPKDRLFLSRVGNKVLQVEDFSPEFFPVFFAHDDLLVSLVVPWEYLLWFIPGTNPEKCTRMIPDCSVHFSPCCSCTPLYSSAPFTGQTSRQRWQR